MSVKGEQKGKAEGREEGKRAAKLATAPLLRRSGLSDEVIAKAIVRDEGTKSAFIERDALNLRKARA